MQVLELIILAALAAVVLYQLYAVLGRRVGRGAEDLARLQAGQGAADAARAPPPAVGDHQPANGLAALRARDPTFDVAAFLQGARGAYQIVVKAFATGDRAALKPLLSPEVMTGFETEMEARERDGRSEGVEFLHPPRADLEEVAVDGDRATAAVRFLAELRKRLKGPEGEAVDEHRTAEVWTFERNLKSRNPNWTLIHVDAAEA